jgi:predicted site-specific integrase-resolvase
MQQAEQIDKRGKSYLSPSEVEDAYPISRWTVRHWAYTGKIESIKLGGLKGRLLIPRAEIERVFEECRRPRVEQEEACV